MELLNFSFVESDINERELCEVEPEAPSVECVRKAIYCGYKITKALK